MDPSRCIGTESRIVCTVSLHNVCSFHLAFVVLSDSHASFINVAWTAFELYKRSIYWLLHWKGIDTFVSPTFFDILSDDLASDDIADLSSSPQ